MNYLGDFVHGQVIDFKFGTRNANGASANRSDAGSIRVYRGNSTTERSSGAGITDTAAFDTVVGLSHLRIDTGDDTDAGFYAPGNDYQVVLVGATIDGQTVNDVLGHFSIENRGQYKVLDTFALTGGSTTTAAFTGVPTDFQANDAYNNYGARIWHANGTVEFRAINDSVFATGTMTLHFDALLTAAASGDRADIIMGAALPISGTPDVNVAQVTGQAARATQLGKGLDTMPTGIVTATGFTPTTTQFRVVLQLGAALGNEANLNRAPIRFRTGTLALHPNRVKTMTFVSGTTYLLETVFPMPVAPTADDELEFR